MKRLMMLVVMSLGVCNISFADTIEDVTKLNSLKQGATTSEDVIGTFGKPLRENHNPDGRFIYVYNCRLPDKDGPSNPPLVGEITFLFGPDHRFVRLSVYQDTDAPTR